MRKLTLTKIRFADGLWEGLLSGASQCPGITVLYRDSPLEGVSLAEAESEGTWHLSVPVPAEAVGDGVQCFVIFDTASGARLGAFTLTGGSAEDAGLRAEMALMRAELDMLKSAFRRLSRGDG